MTVEYDTNGIKIKSKLKLKFYKDLPLWFLLAISIPIAIVLMNDKVIMFPYITPIIMVIVIVFLREIYVNYKYRDNIFMDNMNVKFHIVNAASIAETMGDNPTEDFLINLKSLSKIHLSNENCLLLYDSDGNQDYVFDVSYFTRDDIQVLINVLSKKIPITIDEDLARAENLVVKNLIDNTPQQRRSIASISVDEGVVSSPRRRTVVNERKDRALELVESPKATSQKKIKRRLEL